MNLTAMVSFWRSALHYVPRRAAKDDWVVLRDAKGRGRNMSFQARETRAPRRSWIHLDPYTDRQEEEVNRLLQLGRGAIHSAAAEAWIS